MAKGAVARRSPLQEVYQTGNFGAVKDGRPGVTINERVGLSVVHVAAWDDQAEAAAAAIEKAVRVKPSRQACTVAASGDTVVIWVGPDRWLVVERERRDLEAIILDAVSEETAAVTDQSHSRCVLRISGLRARDVLRKGTTLDMDAGKFNPCDARSTSLFRINGLIHCITDDTFDLHVARSVGQSFFEVLTLAAAEYGYRVESVI